MLLASALIGWVCYTDKFNSAAFAAAITDNTAWVIFASLTVWCMVFVGILRWYVVNKSLSFEISFWNTLKMGLIGVFFKTFMPTGVMGDFARIYYCSEGGLVKQRAVVGVVIDKYAALLSQIGFVSVAGFFVIEKGRNPDFLLMLHNGALTLMAMMVAAIVFSYTGLCHAVGRISPWAAALVNDIKLTRRTFAFALMLSLLNNAILGLSFYLFAQSLPVSIDATILNFLFIAPIIALIMTLPMTPAGIGLGQLVGFYLFEGIRSGHYNIVPEIVTMTQISWLAMGLIGSLTYIGYQKGTRYA